MQLSLATDKDDCLRMCRVKKLMEGAMSCEIEPTSGGFKCFVSKKEAFSGDGTNDVSCVKVSGKVESQY